MSSVEMVQFVITGEFITRQARAFWAEEGEHKRAMELLECMEGLPQSAMLDILEGRAKLVGDSKIGVTLEEDNVPMQTLKDVLSKLREERDVAQDERDDAFQMIAGNTVGVASPTGLRHVPQRKTEKRFGGPPTLIKGYDWEGSGEPGDKEPLYRQSEWNRRTESIVLGSIEAPEPKKVAPVPSDTITGSNGWLSPEGKFYSCAYGGHNQLMWGLDLDTDPIGWVKLQERDGEHHIFPKDYDNVTAVQKEKISLYCSGRGVETPWWVKEEKP
jgi:hypothetical protein